MANTKISQLSAGAPAQSIDLIPIARSGANYSLQVSDVNPMPALGYLGGIGSVTYDRFFVGNAGSGDIALYTVPANKRAFVQMEVFNTAGTTTTWAPEVQLAGAGSFFRLQTGITTPTLNQGTSNLGFIFEAGDVIAINTSQAGLNVFGEVILFSNTAKLRTVRFTGAWTNGNNTIYTATQGTLMAGSSSPFFNSAGSAGLDYVNQSGSAATIAWNLVESGGSVLATNKITNNNNATVANNAAAGGAVNFYLNSGDFLSLSTNQTGQQIAWLSVWEGV